MLKTDGPGYYCCNGYSHKDIRNLWRNPSQPVHDNKCKYTHNQGGPVCVMECGLDDTDNSLVMVFPLVHIYPKHLGQLR